MVLGIQHFRALDNILVIVYFTCTSGDEVRVAAH